MGEIGHKFARLEALRAAGFPVPGFFCLPADEFDRALASLRDALPQAASPPAADWCASAASALSRAVPSGDLADGLLEAFDALVGPGGTAAVRACAVPGEDGGAEDGEDDPFAGMSDSFLYVPRAGLLAAVARCWASAFKPEAVRYRILKGADPASARVAVGIQRMVPGTRSFVAFTRDPRDGTRRHVVAAAHGIGEGVVQEKADVDHFFVDPETGGVRAEIVLKRRMAGPPAARRERHPRGPCAGRAAARAGAHRLRGPRRRGSRGPRGGALRPPPGHRGDDHARRDRPPRPGAASRRGGAGRGRPRVLGEPQHHRELPRSVRRAHLLAGPRVLRAGLHRPLPPDGRAGPGGCARTRTGRGGWSGFSTAASTTGWTTGRNCTGGSPSSSSSARAGRRPWA
ncbi:PEP/pyruvate-binding domain-containing protein [Actinomadura madurae]|nr:PEP/pyruvate-binding domain-containing protein [Actinomadura madurae]MCP9984364.1 PEP/pyruvate-binding domain-containing protein [Actinomadura madurae]